MNRCPTAKIRYHDELSALIALSKIDLKSKRRWRKTRPKYERTVYRCKRCRGWHLSSQ